jgi:hypothetical protein
MTTVDDDMATIGAEWYWDPIKDREENIADYATYRATIAPDRYVRVTCPGCGLTITRRQFKRHMTGLSCKRLILTRCWNDAFITNDTKVLELLKIFLNDLSKLANIDIRQM